MAATTRKCPSCAGALASPQATQCEWCGTPLAGIPVATTPPPFAQPVPPVDTARLAQALRQLEAQRGGSLSRARGCLFFVLLAGTALFVFLLLFASAREPTPSDGGTSSEPPPPTAAPPTAAETPVERPSGR